MKIQSYCEGLKGVVEGVHKVSKALGGVETSSNIPDALQEVATAIESGGGGGGATYTGGYGIDVVNHEISIDDTVVATKSNTYTKAEVDALIPEDEIVYFTYYRHYPSRPVPTVGEIIEAYNAGKTVYLRVVYEQKEADGICPIDFIMTDDNYVQFASPKRIFKDGMWHTFIYYYEVSTSGITETVVEIPSSVELTYNSSTLAQAKYAAIESCVKIIDGTVVYQPVSIQSTPSNTVTFFVLDGENNQIVQYVVTDTGWTKNITKTL